MHSSTRPGEPRTENGSTTVSTGTVEYDLSCYYEPEKEGLSDMMGRFGMRFDTSIARIILIRLLHATVPARLLSGSNQKA